MTVETITIDDITFGCIVGEISDVHRICRLGPGPIWNLPLVTFLLEIFHWPNLTMTGISPHVRASAPVPPLLLSEVVVHRGFKLFPTVIMTTMVSSTGPLVLPIATMRGLVVALSLVMMIPIIPPRIIDTCHSFLRKK